MGLQIGLIPSYQANNLARLLRDYSGEVFGIPGFRPAGEFANDLS